MHDQNYRVRRFNSFFGKYNQKRICNSYYCKSRLFKAAFSESYILNVNFRGSIITQCSFKGATLIGVDFWGTNLSKCNFTNTHLVNTIFVGANLTGSSFRDTHFSNVYFVNTNFKDAKHLSGNENGLKVFKDYPQPSISQDIKEALDELKKNLHLFKTRILHLPKNRTNNLNLYLLFQKYSEEELLRAFNILQNTACDIYTFGQLDSIIERIIKP
jgi:hypothetical protein